MQNNYIKVIILHVSIIILDGDKNKSHVNVTLFHDDIIYLIFGVQKEYAIKQKHYKCFWRAWKNNICFFDIFSRKINATNLKNVKYSHGKIVLNLFFKMFSGLFPTSHLCFSPYGKAYKDRLYKLNNNSICKIYFRDRQVKENKTPDKLFCFAHYHTIINLFKDSGLFLIKV